MSRGTVIVPRPTAWATALATFFTTATATAQWQAPPPPAATPAAPPPAFGPNVQAGGLAPPPPMATSNSAAPAVAKDLDRAKEEDSGRGLSFAWVNVEAGFEHVGLQTFNVDEEKLTAGFTDTSGTGPLISAGLGVQLLFATLGARGRVGFFESWQLLTLGGEIGGHIPIGNFEPHVEAGFGYAELASVSGASENTAGAISISGMYGRLGGGLDYYITPAFSVGASVNWEVLILSRESVSSQELSELKESEQLSEAKAQILALDGSGYGSGLGITAVLGLHF